MSALRGTPDYEHGTPPAVGVLLSNLGTPDEPTAPALRRYLREFLSDPRVIELPRFQWWLILNLFILTTRPRKSAELYRKVWTAEGSPLLAVGRRQQAGIETLLRQRFGGPLHVALGMRYGEPSIRRALRELEARGCRRILVVPLYPQYFSGTVGSTFDAVADELKTWRWVPELRFVQHYHDEPGYITALAASVRETWREYEPEKLLLSFHGIPQRYFDAGDPYFCECQKTARLLTTALGLERSRWEISFQSLFGKEEWVKPYTDRTVQALARSGVRSLDVLAPGFSADCLETLEELDGLNREYFTHAGGERFRFIRCLNDRPDHVAFLADLIGQKLHGWVEPGADWDAARAGAEAAASRERAAALRAHPRAADNSPLA